MPWTCFDYPADVPPGDRNRNAAQATVRDLRRMPHSCFSYPLICFSYPEVPLGIGNRDDAHPAPPGLRRMPFGTCFRY